MRKPHAIALALWFYPSVASADSLAPDLLVERLTDAKIIAQEVSHVLDAYGDLLRESRCSERRRETIGYRLEQESGNLQAVVHKLNWAIREVSP